MGLEGQRKQGVHPWVAEGRGRVRFGIAGGPRDWAALRDFVQTVEALGFDSFWRPDHPLALMDCWTTLSAVAAVTRTLRLGTLVSCVSYRNPVVLARCVADVDIISGGRVVLGLGSGDLPDEFQRMGLTYHPVKQRQAALEAALQIIPALLAGERVTHHGQHFQVQGASLGMAGLPVQEPHIPVLVAGGGQQTTLRFVARYADASNLTAAAWGGGAASGEDLAAKYEILRQRCQEAGRPFEAILRSVLFFPTVLAETADALEAKRQHVPPPLLAFADAAALIATPDAAIARIQAAVAAGAEYFVFSILPTDPDGLRLLAERVIPAIASLDGAARTTDSP